MNSDLSLLRWFLQRISGLLLTVCLLVHIITLHFIPNEVINFPHVVDRVQSSLFWLLFYALFLLTTLWHGFNGVYGIINDYAPSSGLRRLIMWFCWLLGIVLFAWGLVVLLVWWVW